tara:strand:+ start:1564 stop:2268 length:705 start_codon:yes stop_codon:yes gene_type:complete
MGKNRHYVDEKGHTILVTNKKKVDDYISGKKVEANALSTKERIALKQIESKTTIDKIRAEESSKEVAGKHLAKMGAFYLLILVLAFIGSVTLLPNEAVAVVAGLITLVVTNLSQILKGIVETKEQKDPIELMYDVAEKNLESSEREHGALVGATERQLKSQVDSSLKQNEKMIQTAQQQQAALLESTSNNHNIMIEMLREAQEKQPTSLSIQPDNVVIKQGDNTVETSTKGKKK